MCTEEDGIGWGFAEIGGCIVVCASELQRLIKMDDDWSFSFKCTAEECVCVCVCLGVLFCSAWIPMGNNVIWKNRSLCMFVTVSLKIRIGKKWWKFLFIFLAVCLQANPNELTNGVINSAFMLLFKDSIRLFAAYNEGVINLLGSVHSLHSVVLHHYWQMIYAWISVCLSFCLMYEEHEQCIQINNWMCPRW